MVSVVQHCTVLKSLVYCGSNCLDLVRFSVNFQCSPTRSNPHQKAFRVMNQFKPEKKRWTDGCLMNNWYGKLNHLSWDDRFLSSRLYLNRKTYPSLLWIDLNDDKPSLFLTEIFQQQGIQLKRRGKRQQWFYGYRGGGGCLAHRKHTCFPPSSHGFETWLCCYFFSLLLTL